MNETLASRARASDDSKRIFDYSSSPFFLGFSVFFFFPFFFYDSASRPSEKRVVKPCGGPTRVVQSLGLRRPRHPRLCFALTVPRSDSFHSSAFDHPPRRRIRYSNASEPVCLSLPRPPFHPFRSQLRPPSIYLSPFRGTTAVLAGC